MRNLFYLLIALALVWPQVSFAQDSETEEEPDAEVTTEEDADGDAKEDSDAESPNAEGKKELELEDLKLWSSMDLDKDGKLTVSEFERFSRSPNARAFVRQMRAHKAVEEWANKLGIDVEKAKAAMMVGANAQRRQNMLQHQYAQRINANRRRAAIARRNQQAYYAHQQRQNYWSRLGINPYLQRYYSAMRRYGKPRRREEL